MYDAIRKHPSVSAIYADRLASESVVDKTMTDEMIERFVKHLDEEFEAGKAYLPNKADWFEGRWTGLGKPADPETARRAADTGVHEARLKQVARTLTTVPDGFHLNTTLARITGPPQATQSA